MIAANWILDNGEQDNNQAMFFRWQKSVLMSRRAMLLIRAEAQRSFVADSRLQSARLQDQINAGSAGIQQDDNCGVQQDDNYREFMGWITDGGLRYAVAKQRNDPNSEKFFQKTVDAAQKRNVIIVGAGMSGLSAAYELAQVGHEVTILEKQFRVGGRVKTIREGFTDGLHSEAGAMRLPKNHFLTNNYIKHFDIQTRQFEQYNENAYMYIYKNKIKTKEWESQNLNFSNRFWPGWDINQPHKYQGINDYFEDTIKKVVDDLGPNPTEEKWQEWINKWSKYSVEGFLREEGWPEIAIQGYQVMNYLPMFDSDLATFTRERLGEWWKPDQLTAPVEGLDTLPKAFLKPNTGWNLVNLSKQIRFGFEVSKVEKLNNGEKVLVIGTNTSTGEVKSFLGDAVIITTPLNILRQMDLPLSIEKIKATEGIRYMASTKIMLQCKTRFWENDIGSGGFSRTDLPIGQLHYPSKGDPADPNQQRGVLMVYNWMEDALLYGSQTHKEAISSAVEEISKIHPEMKEEFEVGVVQAWYSDSSSQGAFAGLKPYEYINYMDALTTPEHPIYLAGEALSWTNGWIQGAIFSGLMQAFCLQSKIEQDKTISPVNLLHEKIRC